MNGNQGQGRIRMKQAISRWRYAPGSQLFRVFWCFLFASFFACISLAHAQPAARTDEPNHNPMCAKGTQVEPKRDSAVLYNEAFPGHHIMAFSHGTIMTVLGYSTVTDNGQTYSGCLVEADGETGILIYPEQVEPVAVPSGAVRANADQGSMCDNPANLDKDKKMACVIVIMACMPYRAASDEAHRACMDRMIRKNGASGANSAQKPEAASQSSRDDRRARNLLAECHAHPSVETCTDAIQSESLSAEEQSRAYAWRALARAERDNTDADGLAIPDCEKAISLDPNDGLAFFLRGGIYSSRYMQHLRDKQTFSLAIADFDRALALGVPDEVRPMTHQMRAQTYQMAAISDWNQPQSQSEEFRKSRDDYSEAIKLTPGNAQLYASRAFVEKMLGDMQASRDDARTAKRIDPSINADP